MESPKKPDPGTIVVGAVLATCGVLGILNGSNQWVGLGLIIIGIVVISKANA